jgi:DNA-binding GntR family transcriptional regulator
MLLIWITTPRQAAAPGATRRASAAVGWAMSIAIMGSFAEAPAANRVACQKTKNINDLSSPIPEIPACLAPRPARPDIGAEHRLRSIAVCRTSRDTSPMPRPAKSLAAIVGALEEDILFGRLRTRERLIEDELIERFGATRHVVRQALVELERKGMVVRERGRSAVVRDFSREEVEQICAVREMLHAHAAALIPLPAPAALVRRLEKLHDAHSQQVEAANPAGIHRVNNAFHEALFEACGNPFLVQTIRDYAQMSLGFRCHVMVNPFLARRARDEHKAMIAALRKGDRARLVRLCTHHTQAAKDVYLSLQGFGDAGSDRRAPPPVSVDGPVPGSGATATTGATVERKIRART